MITTYIDLGYAAIPCRADKRPSCPHGLNDAAETHAAWRALIEAHPGPNAAIVVPQGVIVIDLDIDAETGLDGVALMRGIMGADWRPEDWPGPSARTPRGGWHLWALAPPGWTGGNHRGALPVGIDVRSNGAGYVLVAPSRTKHGRYQWHHELVPPFCLPELPPQIVALLTSNGSLPPRVPDPAARPGGNGEDKRRVAYAAAALARAEAEIEGSVRGDRNNTLNRVALGIGALVAGGVIGESEATSSMLHAALTCGLPEDEARRTIGSAFRAGAVEPRSLPPPEPRFERSHVGGIPTIDTPPPPADRDAPPDIGAEEPSVSPETVARTHADKREVHVTTHEEEVAAEIIAALAEDPTLWQRDPGELASIRRQVDGPRLRRKDGTEGDVLVPGEGKLTAPIGTPLVWRLSSALVRERISSRCILCRWSKTEKAWNPCHVPEWIVPAVATRGTWDGIPYLRGIVEHPVLRPDGSLLSAHGYDEQSCLYVSETSPQVEYEQHPTREQAQAAASALLDVVQDFPWRDLRSQGAWLCALLTPLARYAIDGPTPLFVIDANIRGAGKTLLCDVIGLALTGRTIPAQTYPAGNDEELEKILVSAALAGVRALNWDNVEGTIGSGVLDKWLTSTHASGRILGGNQQVTMRWDTVQYATSNNATIRADSDRRCIHVKLMSPLEHPEHRDDFHASDLHAYVREHRAELLSHALTILAGHLAAGRPDCGGRAKGSFGAWTHIVRDAVLWCGLPDPELAPDDESRPPDVSEGLLAGLIEGIEDVGGTAGCTTGQLVRAVESYYRDHGACPESLVSAAESACGGRRITAVGLGRRLQLMRDRWLGDKCLVSAKGTHDRLNVWRVKSR